MSNETQETQDVTPEQEVVEETQVVEATAEPAAETVEQVEEATPSEEEAEKPRRKRGAEARIQELVAKQHEAEQENERLRKQLETGQTGAPSIDQFDDYEDYLAAKVRHDIESDNQRKAAEQKAAVDREIAQQRTVAFQEKVQAAKESYPDFEAVAFGPEVTPYITPTVAQAVQATDKSADVAYYLGKNPQVAAELAKLPPIDAALEVGRIEASLPKPKTVTAAPEPLQPVAGGHDGGEVDPSKMTTDQWMAWRNKQLYG